MQTAFLSLLQSASSCDLLTQMHLVSPGEKNVFVHLDVENFTVNKFSEPEQEELAGIEASQCMNMAGI